MTGAMQDTPPVPAQPSAVVGVVSAYNPDQDNVENIKWLLQYVSCVVVVDDGSSTDVASVLDEMRQLGAVVIRLDQNSGIAAALNTGIKEARKRWNPKWIATMDQDSRFAGDYIAEALKAAETSADPSTVAMICAGTHNHVALPLVGHGPEPEVFDPMTSGSLVRATTFDRIGYFNEEYFIDCVDSEFNARLRQARLRAIAAGGCNLDHSLGVARPMVILGWHARVGAKKLFIYYHSPFRVYYITRNSLVMARTYFLKQPRWVLRRLYMELQSHVVRFLFGPNRRKHAMAFGFGLRDAVLGRMGKIEESLAAKLR